MEKTEMKPTKEEILKSKFKNSFLDLDYLELYLEAMQEYAEQFHKEKLREELIKFQIWHEDKLFKCHALEMAVEHNVDEYLKTKG